ncbi:MAG: cyclic nucleotide-binding domain-containing protein [Pseudomonadota bacterium]
MTSPFDTSGGDCRLSNVKVNSCSLCDVRSSSICRDLSLSELAQVDAVMARRVVPKGRAIMSEGEPNDHLFVLVRGSMRLTKYLEDGRRQVTGFLFKGDFIGVRTTKSSAYTAEALDDCHVCRFPHRFLDEAAKTSPDLKDRLIARSQTEYHKAQDHIVLLGKKTAEERVLSFLDLLEGAVGGQRADGDREIPLAMPRQDIADYLGLRLETLSRTFSLLRKKGLLKEVSRNSVTRSDEASARLPSI